MDLAYLRRPLTKAALTLAMAVGIGLATSAPAQAQHRNDHPHDRDYYGYGRNDIYQMARQNGYHDGVEHGREHRLERKRYDPTGTRHYKDATDGYRSGSGDKDTYKQAYREGFRRGYDEGYYGRGRSSGYDPYYQDDPYYGDDRYRRDDPYNRGDRRQGDYGYYGGRNDIYRIAQENGYRDGITHGAEHRSESKRYNPTSTRHYKDADDGYRSEYGSKDAYKQAYRDGFQRGYDEGFRRGGYGRDNDHSRGTVRNRFPWPF